ncbi:MAG: DUF1304 domain-containing protein [Furfurilactobacillus sp.]|jgi:putative membrane protein|uniref:DUF1304 domain-containing protein n=1 Tax=Furfurilactobacillus milii TaxID=2888272 RepID=A0ABT6D872_9LACO|nr:MULTISPECIES: DUF1304 domain-containing protein [Furfurilactobacillus]QLE65715.1 membrane protein [Furfurilactobacillus rossiae]MCF6160374.1 DUF1304 domain-containing protein [Furfurilactobacillus milii]MCF6162317.1 DUF1304 domain-containing protein [Furfurilactobacillus milii]MCF6420070.1 DUF1304 domain-containing protein [Furfurilactobacillus milii]MCH4012240.1 DUF1304 domain-containing protein [Furfurilactobacillus sp.]
MLAFTLGLVAVVGLEHLFIMCLEMFWSTGRIAQQTFGSDASFLEQPQVKAIFKNMGIYNGFVGVGILWSLFALPTMEMRSVLILFTGFVVVAAIVGAVTVSRRIFVVQGLPALFAVLCVLLFL